MNVVISDIGKLALMVVFTIGLFVLVLSGKVDFGEAAPFLTLEVGYLFGNGSAAVRKSAPSSVIVSTLHDGQAATMVGPVAAMSVPVHDDGGNPDG